VFETLHLNSLTESFSLAATLLLPVDRISEEGCVSGVILVKFSQKKTRKKNQVTIRIYPDLSRYKGFNSAKTVGTQLPPVTSIREKVLSAETVGVVVKVLSSTYVRIVVQYEWRG